MCKGFLQKAAALSAKSGSAFRDSRLHFRPEPGTKEFFLGSGILTGSGISVHSRRRIPLSAPRNFSLKIYMYMKKFLMLLPATALLSPLGAAAATELTGEQLAFRSAVMNFLRSEGFVPKVDTRDESIEFKKEGERYWIYVEESSPFYVTLQREGYSIEADQAAKSKEIANRVNRTKKAAKVYVSEASVTFVVEMFAPSAESFEKVFYRTMEQVDAAHDQFTEEYNSTED